MLNIIAICLLASASICLFLTISITLYIFYVVKHRSTNVSFAINIAQNILKRKMLIPLIILLRFHLPFPIMLIVMILQRKSKKKSSSQTKTEEEN
jgi:predicted membrane protein